jgi:hypothetical protein
MPVSNNSRVAEVVAGEVIAGEIVVGVKTIESVSTRSIKTTKSSKATMTKSWEYQRRKERSSGRLIKGNCPTAFGLLDLKGMLHRADSLSRSLSPRMTDCEVLYCLGCSEILASTHSAVQRQ